MRVCNTRRSTLPPFVRSILSSRIVHYKYVRSSGFSRLQIPKNLFESRLGCCLDVELGSFPN
jgi:hypothetical protein